MPGGAHKRQLAELRATVAALERRLDVEVTQARERHEELAGAHQALVDWVEHLAPRAERGLVHLDLLERIAGTTAWVAALAPSETLVSIVMPTRNRAAMLAEAAASVRAQRHQAWELLVVDDGSSDETPELLAELAAADARIRPLRGPATGTPGPARNVALQAARGSVIAYLDDDNLMAEGWLAAVVWAFDQRPDAELLYGARLYEHADSIAPYVEMLPWDRARLELTCTIDQNVLAHRAGLAEAPQAAMRGADWEMLLRATLDREPLALPVIAASYRTLHDERLCKEDGALDEWTRIQQLALRMRPLRVLGTPGAADALRALGSEGAAVAVWDAALERPVDAGLGGPADVALVGDALSAEALEALRRGAIPFALVGAGAGVEVDDASSSLLLGTAPAASGDDGPALLAWLMPALDLWRARLIGHPDPLGEPAPVEWSEGRV